MEISVIIPTWNRSDLVQRAVNSALNQTKEPKEVIVVDDGSDDDTRERIAADFPHIRMLVQSNKGVSAARNHGIREATGDWIAFLDSDDEWLPDKLAVQQDLLRCHPDLRACHTEEIWIRNGRRVNPKQKHAKPVGWIFNHCLPLCCVSPSSVMLHRSIFEHIGPFDESLPACEDYDMWLRVFHKYPIGLVETPMLIKYGGHSDQLSRLHWGMDRFRVKSIDRILRAGQLEEKQAQACIAVLKQKCDVLIGGCVKRGKTGEADHFRALMSAWTS
ncbi:MAG: glycosyltransferase family 2 protein [bacterium]